MSKTKKTVKITESELVDMIDNIVTEALVLKKKEWIQEQANSGNKLPMLEQQVSELTAKVTQILEQKK